MQEIEYIIAKKYAVAFINLHSRILDDESIKKVIKVRDFLKKNNMFYVYLRIPTIDHNIKKDALQRVITAFTLEKCFDRLFFQLLDDGRVEVLDKVLDQIVTCYRLSKDIRLFKITTSHELGDKERKDVIDFVEDISKKNVITKFFVDPKLICGFRIQSTNFLWERSISKQLRDIKRNIFKQVGVW